MESNEVTQHWRYRVNVSTSTKGVHTYDCTVEGSGPDLDDDEVLTKSDALVARLDERYKDEWNV
jgi:hypothetical protein